MEQQEKIRRAFFLACSVFGLLYFAAGVAALFVGGQMRELLFSSVTGSVGDLLSMATVLLWWISMQFYLRVLPQRKLPSWAKRLCVADLAAFAMMLLLRLLSIDVL